MVTGAQRALRSHGSSARVSVVPFGFLYCFPRPDPSSDGLFNLGSALSFVQALSAGVYIAMNGKFFPWDRVRKNRERGEFEEIP